MQYWYPPNFRFDRYQGAGRTLHQRPTSRDFGHDGFAIRAHGSEMIPNILGRAARRHNPCCGVDWFASRGLETWNQRAETLRLRGNQEGIHGCPFGNGRGLIALGPAAIRRGTFLD